MNSLTNWSDLPLGLNANHVSKILGLSKPLVYELFNREDFPSIKVSEKRWMVSKEHLRLWMEKRAFKNEMVVNV